MALKPQPKLNPVLLLISVILNIFFMFIFIYGLVQFTYNFLVPKNQRPVQVLLNENQRLTKMEHLVSEPAPTNVPNFRQKKIENVWTKDTVTDAEKEQVTNVDSRVTNMDINTFIGKDWRKML